LVKCLVLLHFIRILMQKRYDLFFGEQYYFIIKVYIRLIKNKTTLKHLYLHTIKANK
jgi:hypothetical protein